MLGNNGKATENYSDCNDVSIVHKSKLSHEDWLAADQVLTGSNALRRKLNRFFRNKLNKQGNLPVEGEKLICLKNDFNRYGLVNGIFGNLMSDIKVDDLGEAIGTILFEGQIKVDIPFYTYPFFVHYDSTSEEEPWALRNDLAEFDWAYAITVHKSQGSEWENVILADDGFWSNRVERKSWLYTGITRAKQNLTWVVE